MPLPPSRFDGGVLSSAPSGHIPASGIIQRLRTTLVDLDGLSTTALIQFYSASCRRSLMTAQSVKSVSIPTLLAGPDDTVAPTA